MKASLLKELEEKKITREAMRKKVESDFGLLPEVFSGLSSSKASVRYTCASVLVELSAKYPEKIYPYIDEFAILLESKYRILKWNGMAALANLSAVDEDKKFDAIFEKFYSFLDDEYLVTVANVVGNSSKIALAKPYLIPRITSKILSVEKLHTTPHLTEECKRVVAEKAVEVFASIFEELTSEDKKRVCAFVKKQAQSSRRSLKAKAEHFLKQ